MSEPLTLDERALFERTFAELQKVEQRVAEQDEELKGAAAELIDTHRKLQATEVEVRGLRALIRTMSETTGRAGFRLDFEQDPDGKLRFTIASSAGAAQEALQAQIVGGVLSALMKFDVTSMGDAEIAPDEDEPEPSERTRTQEVKADLRRHLLGDDAE